MRISVIVPGYNDADGVLTALNSLRSMAVGDVEYIVQDDASPNVNLLALVGREIASVERNSENLGFAGSCNAAAARATGDVLFFVNQDVYAVFGKSEGWDEGLRAAFRETGAGIVGPRLLFPDGKVQSVGGLFDAKGQPFHRALGWANPYGGGLDQAMAVSWATGAALAVRRDVFEAVDGFDTLFRMYFEDADLCLRAAQIGAATWYWPGVTLIHRVGSTGGSFYFHSSARKFAERWAHQIRPDVPVVKERFW